MAYYSWSVAFYLPQLRLAVCFVGVQLFRVVSWLHQLGAVSVPGAVPGCFVVINNRICSRFQ
jgi:hypothetical protein